MFYHIIGVFELKRYKGVKRITLAGIFLGGIGFITYLLGFTVILGSILMAFDDTDTMISSTLVTEISESNYNNMKSHIIHINEQERIAKEKKAAEDKHITEKKNAEKRAKEKAAKEKELAEKKKNEKAEEEKRLAEAKKKEEEAAKKEAEKISKETEKNASKYISPVGLEQVTVARFVDGDTTRFYYNGEDVSFRYLLIDTPETKHPRVGKQPFGQEASDRTRELLSNAQIIEVEYDIGEKTDKYNRHLAYIYADGVMVNEVLVREGLAQVNYVYPPNTRHLERLKEAERLAKNEGIGIWSLDSPFDDPSFQEPASSSSSNNNNSSNNSNYNTNTPPASSNTTEFFQNCTELTAVYPNGVPSDHPAYQAKMDRDKDNWACER